MYYIIQENMFREYHYNTLIEYLQRYGLEYETVKYKPFVHEIDVVTKRKDVWFFGSVNGARVVEKMEWNPGSLYNDSHDFEVYGKHYGTNMLNHDGIVIKITDPMPEDLPYAFFARPTKDTKIFSGQCFTKDSWNEWVNETLANATTPDIVAESNILVAPLKTTQQEIRCWIINSEPVTISQYKIGSRVVYQNMDNNEEAYIYAKQMAKLFSPAKAFVLDICLYNDDYKVVEVNCINCSGFYDLNMSKLLQALENTFK